MLFKLKKITNTVLKKPRIIGILKVLAVLSLASLATHAFAAGTDLLSGTEANLVETLNKTGKKYLYIAEGITALVTGIMTKNWVVLIGIIVVAVFLNIVLTMAA